MPLESATYITDLVVTNPIHTDGLDDADAHLRLIKSVVQTTFPNLNGAVTATPAELNAAGLANATAGVYEIANNGSTGAELILDGPTGSGDVMFENTGSNGNPGALTVQIEDATGANPLTAMTVSRAGVVAAPTFNATTAIQQGGNTLIPSGFIGLWSGAANAIPAGWLLCNGSNGTPDLRDRFVVGAGNTYAVSQTGGATSTNPTTTTNGLHTHTGATGAAGGVTPTGTTDSQGNHSHTGSTQDYTLQVADIPPHSHTEQLGQATGSGSVNGWVVVPSNTIVSAQVDTLDTGGGGPHSHGIVTDGAHSHNLTMNAIPAHTHSISTDGSHSHSVVVATLPPFYALCYIMKS